MSLQSKIDRPTLWFGLGAAACLLTVAFMTWAFLGYTQDDVYITYTYSRNLAEGHGLVFNPGEHIQGTTTPLWALTMAGVYKLTTDLQTVGNVLCGLLLLLTLFITYHLTANALSLPARFLLLCGIASAPLFYLAYGMETMLYCAVLAAAFLAWRRGQIHLAFALAGVLTWVRADGVVLAGAFGICLLAKVTVESRQPRLLRLVFSTTSVYLVVIAPWFIFAALYFGSPLPNTFSAKANFFGGWSFVTHGWDLFKVYYGNNPLHLAVLILIPLGVVRLLRSPALRPVAVWCLAYGAGYTILNTTYFWYYVPLNLGLLICLAFGADTVARYISQRWNTNAGFRLVAIYALVTLIAGIVTVYPLRVLPFRMATYRLAGEWIAENTPKTATLTVADLGIVGYYARRHTVDTFGLIAKNNYSIAPDYVLAKHRTDYVLLTSYYVFNRLRTRSWFVEQYTPVRSFSTPGDVEFSPMTLYARKYPLKAPESVVQGEPLALTCKMALDKGAAVPRTVALVFDDGGERVARAAQRFRSGDYRVALGKEALTDQILVPTDELEPGTYRWELRCAETSSGTFTVVKLDENLK